MHTQGISSKHFEYSNCLQKISDAIQKWETTRNSVIKSCQRLEESHKEDNRLANVQPCFSLPILNELIETRLDTSRKLAIGKYQEKSFDAIDKFNVSTNNLLSIMNSLVENIMNHQSVSSNQLPKVMTIQSILNSIDAFKTLLINEYDAIRLYHVKRVFIHSDSFNDLLVNSNPLPDNSPTKLVWCNEFIVQLNTLLDFLI
uniref:AATF-Che1 domain-containing protein n=1 Tax=Trichobilharzia regenti TaxID=157069 RepID=A0AA85K8Z5_TRIRE|nr:unnamed protein product [Trichobilharzia regenti]